MNSIQLKHLREQSGMTREQSAWSLGLPLTELKAYEENKNVPKLVHLACKELYRNKSLKKM
jgi:DNA-binding transcriptional regulator YiaG